MQVRFVAGPVYVDGEFVDGYVAFSREGLHEVGEGAPPEPPVATGIVIPGLVNAHTHVGDSFARGIPVPSDLVEAVKPPHGLKHRLLASTPREKIVRGMCEAMGEMAAAGVRVFCDFREGGVAGFEALAEARLERDLACVALTRPADLARASDAEVQELLARSDGFGVSGIADGPYEALDALSRAAHAAGKLFAMHASEGEREDMGRILDLSPDLLVHLTEATDDDLAEVAAEDIPVVICPRSNAHFGLQPDAEAMLEAGITLALGTDNGMLHAPDVLAELRFLHASEPGIPPVELLEMATGGGHKALNRSDFMRPLAPGGPADFVVVGPIAGSAWETLFAPDARVTFDPLGGG